MKPKLFYALTLATSLAAFWLKFFADGWLRGNLYDVLLVAILSSATFTIKNAALINPVGNGSDVDVARRAQKALNRKIAIFWTLIACGAELMQGVMKLATGKPALGTFDPIDLACYVAGAGMAFVINQLLYIDKPDP